MSAKLRPCFSWNSLDLEILICPCPVPVLRYGGVCVLDLGLVQFYGDDLGRTRATYRNIADSKLLISYSQTILTAIIETASSLVSDSDQSSTTYPIRCKSAMNPPDPFSMYTPCGPQNQEMLTLPMNASNGCVTRSLASVDHKVADRAEKVVLVNIPVVALGGIWVRIWKHLRLERSRRIQRPKDSPSTEPSEPLLKLSDAINTGRSLGFPTMDV
ncbi:hypothetical protein AG1IA_09287 [Rhizoctonia solani AG-1 IA]|uniref:Uncharacterized protein n=1 Tax=Thanatephorus cucumeris (strain AG1-IA) TaxID=983506 RepID=L8WEQ9_THACA|nr:hypothetical protein AG1IA_09287 [Rhizoctonia solani AG-1 IA]